MDKWKRLSEAGPAIARDLAGVAGATAIAAGAGMIYLPAGMIVGGAELVAIAVLLARSDRR